MKAFSLLLVLTVLFAGAVGVSADHTTTLETITCDPANNTVVVTVLLDDPNPLWQSNGVRVYIDGNEIDHQSGSGYENGPIVFTFVNPAFVDGVTVTASRYYNPTPTISVTCAPPENPTTPAPMRFGDGRINAYDMAAPAAVYPADGGLTLFSPDGVLLAAVDAEALADAGPGSTILADEATGIVISRLEDGRIQVNVAMPNGKVYVLIFEEPLAEKGYVSFELEKAAGHDHEEHDHSAHDHD
jgi:hypothetical protein